MLSLFAQQEGGAGILNLVIPLVGMLLLMYFLMILPMRKQKREMAAMMAALKKGDEVITSAGIIGVIEVLKEGEEEMIIRSDNSRLRIMKSTIYRINKPNDAPAALTTSPIQKS